MQFDEQSIRRIIRSVLDSEKRNQSTPIGGRRRRGVSSAVGAYLGKTQAAIPAANWASTPPVLGKGFVNVFGRLTTGTGTSLEQIAGYDEWYNGIAATVRANTVVMAMDWEGVKLIIVESCV